LETPGAAERRHEAAGSCSQPLFMAGTVAAQLGFETRSLEDAP
jgi:hypothetical protein